MDPPPRPLVTVVANLKEDPLGRLYARKQMVSRQFLAGRSYQENYDAAQSARSAVSIVEDESEWRMRPEPLTDRQRKAAAKLRSIETQVQRRYGDAGLWLVRLVLAERRPLEATARLAGASSAREMSSWCWLFQKVSGHDRAGDRFCLRLAPAIPAAAVEWSRRATGPAMIAAGTRDADELLDPRLRVGRANGTG